MRDGLDVTAKYSFMSNTRTKYSMSARSHGTTKSGHNWTTVGNNLINLAIAIHTCIVLRLRARIIVGGDDLLIMVHESSRIPTAEEVINLEKRSGIIPELGILKGWQNVSFVSGVFFPLEHGIGFGPKPGRLVQRLFWATKYIPADVRDDYVRVVSAGIRAGMAGHPIIGAFLDAHGGPAPAKKMSDAQANELTGWLKYSVRGLKGESRPFDPEALMQFYCRKYDTDPSEIAEVERMFKEHKGKVGVVYHPLLARMAEFDGLDPADRPEFEWN